jgi:hypothetical protein
MLLLRIWLALAFVCYCAEDVPSRASDTVMTRIRRSQTPSSTSRRAIIQNLPELAPSQSTKPFLWNLIPASCLFYFIQSTWDFGEINSLIYALFTVVAIYTIGGTHFQRHSAFLLRQPGWRLAFKVGVGYSAVKVAFFLLSIAFHVLSTLFEVISEALLSPLTPWPVWLITLLFLLYTFLFPPRDEL